MHKLDRPIPGVPAKLFQDEAQLRQTGLVRCFFHGREELCGEDVKLARVAENIGKRLGAFAQGFQRAHAKLIARRRERRA